MPSKKAPQKAKSSDLTSFHTLKDEGHNQQNAFDQQQTGRGIIGSGKTMAEDPAFEMHAGALEMAFGKAAMTDSNVTGAVQEMSDQIITMIQNLWTASQQEGELDMASAVGECCGTRPSMKGVAGAVTKDRVYAHMLEGGGNTRTKMTALYNFGRPFQKKLQQINSKNRKAEFLALFEGSDTDTSVLDARMDSLAENPKSRLTPNPTNADETAVATQTSTRGAVGSKGSWKSGRSGEDVGGLHADELKFQGLNDQTDQLKWEEGARKWLINEDDTWVQSVRELSLPLKAGPSGTTDRIMQTRDLLGVSNPESARAACLAYLLPINAHSMVEIMEAAKRFGPSYVKGKGMYANVAPFGSLETYSPSADFWADVVGNEVDNNEVVDDS